MLENQVKWWLEWMRKTKGSLVIYRDSSRELGIDPTFFSCARRYSWADFAKVQDKFPLVLDYPKLPSLEHYSILTK